MNRMFFNIISSDVAKAKNFYVDLLDMEVHFDSDWFVILKPKGSTPFELGIIDKDHEIAPKEALGSINGIYPTFVVEDVNEIHNRALETNSEIVEQPTDMFYGQRRMLVRDLDGMILDISSLAE